LRLIATALLYSWPMVTTGCTGNGTATSPFQLSRAAPEGLGNRFMLGLVTLGDARRYDLTVANLQASPGHFVAADDAGMAAALKLAKPVAKLKPFRLSQTTIRKSKTAYPATTIVYTAAKLVGLPKTTAADVAQFIKVSSTEGQVSGRGNGQLPEGYLPITKSGQTKRLFEQAQQVASAVATQQLPAQKAPATKSAGAPSSPSTGPSIALPGADTSSPPVSSPEIAPSDSPTEPTTVTAALSSSVGGSLLPLLLLLLIAAGAGTAGTRYWLRRQGPR
jgi:hypothetical protein